MQHSLLFIKNLLKSNILKIFLFLFFLSSALFAEEITFKQILENPTDIELNLKYAKQQEQAGNYKSTIATLERLNMLYPANTDIKIYLLSILLKMDSEIRVQLMIERMLKDPNTTDEAKEYINKVTSTMYAQKKQKKWFAYADLSLSQTENSNIDAVSRSSSLWVQDQKLAFAADSVTYDKSMTRGVSFTIGKNLDNTSAVSLNLGFDLTTQRYGDGDESDLASGSISYSKSLGKHFLLPYVYYSRPNNRLANDYNSRGIGFNNSYFINKKNRISYSGGYSSTAYDNNNNFTTANKQNNETYSTNIAYSYDLTPKDNLNPKIFYNKVIANADYNGNENFGLTLAYARVLPFELGLLRLESTYKKKQHDDRDSFVNTTIGRQDQEIIGQALITGRLNRILPFLKKIDKNGSLFYSLKYRKTDVDSTLVTNTVETEYLTYKITKRLNFNELF